MDLNPCQSVSLLLLLEYKQSFKFGGVDNCQKYLIETCGFRPLSHPFSYLGLCLCPFLFKFLICSLFSLTCHFARFVGFVNFVSYVNLLMFLVLLGF